MRRIKLIAITTVGLALLPALGISDPADSQKQSERSGKKSSPFGIGRILPNMHLGQQNQEGSDSPKPSGKQRMQTPSPYGSPYSGYGAPMDSESYNPPSAPESGKAPKKGGSSFYQSQRSRNAAPDSASGQSQYQVDPNNPPYAGETWGQYEQRLRNGKSGGGSRASTKASPTPDNASANAVDSPGARKMKEYLPSASPTIEIDTASNRLNKALEERNFEKIDEESDHMRQTLEDMKQRSEDESLPLQQRLEIKSAIPGAEEGLQAVQEGSRNRHISKIKYGLQQIQSSMMRLIPGRSKKQKD